VKIDIATHISPMKYQEALSRLGHSVERSISSTQMLYDLDLRFKFMDKYEGLVHVLTISSPPIEEIVDPEKAVDLAKLANDEMAELVVKYPDKFIGAVAALPMNNIDAALEEVDRAITKLNLRGIQIYTPTNDKPLDSPEFMPLYEKMSEYDLPIWIHPTRSAGYADYRTEKSSEYGLSVVFGWPFETSLAMVRLVFSGIFNKWPNLKFITHHCGGMLPFFEQRLDGLYAKRIKLTGQGYGLTKAPTEYCKMFYADTALYGGISALVCGYAFFGADNLLFGTDMPLGDSEGGTKNTKLTIDSIEQMNISDSDKKKIFEDNARRLLRLPT